MIAFKNALLVFSSVVSVELFTILKDMTNSFYNLLYFNITMKIKIKDMIIIKAIFL